MKPEHTKKNPQKISMRDHSNYEKIPKKCTLLNVLLFITNFMEIVKSLRTKSFPQETSKIKKKILKTVKNQKKIFYFKFS
jgi:hypothetical protein